MCSDPAVAFAVAFGSQITGTATSSSDLDLAVKFADEHSTTDRFRKRCLLSGTLQREDAPFVDISDLEALPIDVAHDALNGEFVCGDEQLFREFKTEVEAEFRDRREEVRHRQSEIIDRIAEDGLRG
ncbi:type VII toxin-antitoxin system MntA family adenylyltransferase antitoxin [Halosimplex pelagicum]|uniref:Nucleotidyltransferase domain-containing protein n=1 Tax=Halosimplex pelagicum TaxID=869886 RepID=A0A7D5PCQ4_9EURY|nr:nucleotidyltransferase domain-containing protein [Halosimplex pelagicum]QLH84924.1 nucleotidyltransferase domain-containing protein [Halosimplex pelagicum]